MAQNKSTTQRYLLLPPRGLQTSASQVSAHLSSVMVALRPAAARPMRAVPGMKVLDAVHEDGIKLVEMDAATHRSLREQEPGLRIVPEVFYRTARQPIPEVRARVSTQQGAAPSTQTSLRFVDDKGQAVVGASVVAFTNFAERVGAQGKTRSDGSVNLKLGGTGRIQRLYVYPVQGIWPLMKTQVALPRTKALVLHSIDLSGQDSLQYFAQRAPKGDGQGVVVGIIDTGVGPHRDLAVAGGENTVVGEDPGDFLDNGEQHGTHVAGIVGSSGSAPTGMRGLAPKATLRAYRVFGKSGDGASNFSIAKAIDRAVADGCDLINMSLGGEPGGPADPATSAAIADARAAGVVVVCAAGNESASQLDQPGADSRAVAVGAFGRVGLFPKDSVTATNLGKPGADKRNVMASFSNHADGLDFAGPGLGVVSTVPVDAWAVMDGTSMACPALTGAIARILSTHATLLAAPRNQERSDAILKLAFKAAKSLGFGTEYEGSGWPSK